MPIIKRYSNRKLYNTSSKEYVSLDDVAGMVRSGEDVKILDHATGEDITTQTLFQILFEEEKRIGGLMPQIFLTRLIRSGSAAVNQVRKTFSRPLYPSVSFTEVNFEIERRLQNLVQRGDLSYDESMRLQELLLMPLEEPDHVVESNVIQDEEAPPIPEDLMEQLLGQLDRLEAELEELRRK
jgi:polyhydroxyalkanoate synthesis repressor PhaR